MAQHIITGSYDYSLIILSAFLAVFVAYTCMELTRCILQVRKAHRRRWIISSAVVMGAGVWASQLVSILSLTLPIHTDLSLRIATLGLLIAIISAGVMYGANTECQ